MAAGDQARIETPAVAPADGEEIAGLSRELEELVHQLLGQMELLNKSLLANESPVAEFVKAVEEASGSVTATVRTALAGIAGVRSSVTGLAAELNGVHDALNHIIAEAEEAPAGLTAVAADVSGHIEQTADQARDMVESFIDRQREALDEAVLQAGDQLREAFSETFVSKVRESIDELVDAVAEQVKGTLQPVANEVADGVGQLIDGLVEDLAQGSEETRRENAPVQAAIDALRPATEAIMEQFDRVSALAKLVGM